MPKWSTWSGNHKARPSALTFLRSEEDAIACVKRAAAEGRTLRVAGSGHSHAPLIPTDDEIVDLTGLSGVLETDSNKKTARVRAGSPIYALGRPLQEAGLGLANQGDIDRQAIAGVVSTGTHGTGRALKNLSAGVVGAKIVLADGSHVQCSANERPEIFQAMRLSLGAFGLITELEMQMREAYRLREKAWQEDFTSLVPKISELSRATRHFEFFWSPVTDEAFAKTIEETDEPAVYPLAPEGERLAWSYEVLPNFRPALHTEMEYSVPEENGIPCLKEIRALMQKDFPDVKWPVEFRTLAADDVWMSSAYERQTVTLSVHQGINEPAEPFFRACEKIFLSYGGRPHWGKVHYLDGPTLRSIHPKWDEWWAARDSVDPKGIFLNDYLRAMRG